MSLPLPVGIHWPCRWLPPVRVAGGVVQGGRLAETARHRHAVDDVRVVARLAGRLPELAVAAAAAAGLLPSAVGRESIGGRRWRVADWPLSSVVVP